MFRKIIDAIKNWFSPSAHRDDIFAGEMTEEDWKFADEHIDHLFNELKLDYKITRQKVRLVLVITPEYGIPKTYYIHYAKFMNDPRISLYIRDVLEL